MGWSSDITLSTSESLPKVHNSSTSSLVELSASSLPGKQRLFVRSLLLATRTNHTSGTQQPATLAKAHLCTSSFATNLIFENVPKGHVRTHHGRLWLWPGSASNGAGYPLHLQPTAAPSSAPTSCDNGNHPVARRTTLQRGCPFCCHAAIRLAADIPIVSYHIILVDNTLDRRRVGGERRRVDRRRCNPMWWPDYEPKVFARLQEPAQAVDWQMKTCSPRSSYLDISFFLLDQPPTP